jgi:hypothetical protein
MLGKVRGSMIRLSQARANGSGTSSESGSKNSPPFPYLWNNTAPIQRPNIESGQLIVKDIEARKAQLHIASLFRREYSRLLVALSQQDDKFMKTLTEFKLFLRLVRGLRYMNKDLKVVVQNPMAPIKVRLLHGKYIMGGYISRKREIDAKIRKARQTQQPSPLVLKYVRDDIDSWRYPTQFLLNLTAEIQSSYKVSLVPRAGTSADMPETQKNQEELHYLTMEGVLFNATNAKETASANPNILLALDQVVLVDLDYALDGNPHYKE